MRASLLQAPTPAVPSAWEYRGSGARGPLVVLAAKHNNKPSRHRHLPLAYAGCTAEDVAIPLRDQRDVGS